MRLIVTTVETRDSRRSASWDVRTLLGHIGAVATALEHLVATGKLELRPLEVNDTELVDAVRARMTSAVDAVAAADDSDRAETAATSGVIEFATHGWDLATAVGTRLPLDAVHAEQARRLAESLVRDDARDDNFAAARTAPSDGTPLDSLAAFLGRSSAPTN